MTAGLQNEIVVDLGYLHFRAVTSFVSVQLRLDEVFKTGHVE